MSRIAAALLIALSGCATEETGDLGTANVDPDALRVLQTGDLATGIYDDGQTVIQFRSQLVDGTDLDIELVFNEIAVTLTADLVTGVAHHDAFVVSNGAETQFTDADRAAMFVLNRAIEALEHEPSEPVVQLRRFTSTWSTYPSTVDPRGTIHLETARDWTSICSAMNTYQAATHDGLGESRWDDDSTVDFAYVSMHSAGPCSDGTYFWSGGQWVCYEPDHDSSIEYSYGNCFGRCGGSCGSDTQFTWDCLDHDECVRFGHSLASFWCDDEFVSASDDFLLAPNC